MTFQVSNRVTETNRFSWYLAFIDWNLFMSIFLHLLQMRELGICNRLDQVFDAPDAVKDVLISQAGLEHSVFLLCLTIVVFL